MATVKITNDFGQLVTATVQTNPIVNGKVLSAERIVAAVKKYYPNSLNAYENEDVYLNKPFFIGIRTKSCGVSGVKGGVTADDFFVMLQRKTSTIHSLISEWSAQYFPITTDPTAAFRQKPIAGAKKTGYLIARNWKPTALIPEFCGHYLYQIGNYGGQVAFLCRTEQNVWQFDVVPAGKQQIPFGMTADAYAKQIQLLPKRYAAGMFIHRSWGKLMWTDSAGCQVFEDNNDLKKVFNEAVNWQNKLKKRKVKFSKYFDYILMDGDMID
jgi:hypothetical protein